jgi:tetratricopeptide (TPR) repeat protein
MIKDIQKRKLLINYTGTIFVLFIIFLGVFVKLDIFSNLKKVSAKDEKEAGELLDKGCILFEEGNYENAIEVWEEVYYDYKGTTSWGKATYNIGLGYLSMEEYKKAIPYFEEILESDVDDLEPGQCVMEAYRNYRHKSCLQISYCYEQLRDLDKALKYAIFARDKYPYQSWCGTCQMSAERSLEYKIQRLTIYKNWESNKNIYCEFKLEYEIISDSDIEYNLYLPYPKAIDQSTSHFINQTKIVYGNPDYNIVNERNSIGLNITCKGSCMIEIKYIK